MSYDPDLYGPPEHGNEDPEADYAAEVYHEAAREYDEAEADEERPGVYYPWHDKPWVIAQNKSLDRGEEDEDA